MKESRKYTNIHDTPIILYNPVKAWVISRDTPTPWKSGDILHISITPVPNCWPRQSCRVNNGRPKTRESRMNWNMKLAPKWMVNTAKRETLNSPKVQPRQAIMELILWGHLPRGLSASGISLLVRWWSHDLKKNVDFSDYSHKLLICWVK